MNPLATLIDLPIFTAHEGSLGVLEKSSSVPFEPKRTYFILGVPEGTKRGFHAHRELEQVMVALTGSFVVTIDDGLVRTEFLLDSPGRALHVKRGAWREMSRFSTGSVCLVVASMPFEESDYIRNYEEFLIWRGVK